jgi:protoporphyrinogen oxidase
MSGVNTKPVSRKQFLRWVGALSLLPLASRLASCTTADPLAHIRISMPGAASKTGHRLRGGHFPEPSETIHTRIAIAGSGIAGLSAARELALAGEKDFLLLELEDHTGGNSAQGQNKYSAYPRGAHYLPIPNPEDAALVAFLEAEGIITGFDDKGLPIYRETDLCFDPEERLYFRDRWQDGLIPNYGLSAAQQEQTTRFLQQMDQFRKAKGQDGQWAFCIPVDNSSADTAYTSLDQLTMAAWLQQQGYTAEPLLWYVNYCCRDDYGAGIDRVSAWAGIHYFAGRKGQAANAESSAVLTWPEGNGHLANLLRQHATAQTRTQTLVYQVQIRDEKVELLCWNEQQQSSFRILTDRCLLAVPQMVVKRIFPQPAIPYDTFEYAPWMVANLTLKQLPATQGRPLSWDNVIYNSPSLGYVNAQQQQLSPTNDKLVLTYYYPLDQDNPAKSRQAAYTRAGKDWLQAITADLEKVHRGITPEIEAAEIWLWGHGMVIPHPGFITGAGRRQAAQPVDDKVYFAHTDLSGVSIFEEGFHRGRHAALQILQSLRS